MKVAVIVPVFNEIATIGEILQRVRAAPVDAQLELIVVDDGSSDGTREFLPEAVPNPLNGAGEPVSEPAPWDATEGDGWQ